MLGREEHEAFRDALNRHVPGWTIVEQGLLGPHGALVRLEHRHPSHSDGHVDVELVLDASSDPPVALWDCVSGVGETAADRARTAAQIWGQTTASAWLELRYSGRGELADHYRGHDEGGFPGWHIIQGGILGYGRGESPNALQQWWLQNPVLPAVAAALADSLDERACPHGIKILFGGSGIAEVRLDGEVHEGASEALARLPWPRLEPAGFVRSYVVVLHRGG